MCVIKLEAEGMLTNLLHRESLLGTTASVSQGHCPSLAATKFKW